MKISTWLILIFALLIVFYIPFDYNAGLSEKVEDESLRVEGYALSASQAALSNADIASDVAFGSKNVRKDAVNTFYEVYARCINVTGDDANKVKYNIPCIILADNDGYYISYTQWTKTTGETLYVDIITEKQYYIEQYGSFCVLYQLNNIVTVSDMSGNEEIRIKGTYERVYEELLRNYGLVPEDIIQFESKESFCKERNLIVTKSIEKTAEYYINTHNSFFNRKDIQYKITLPSGKENEVAGLLNSPSVISFVQGSQGEMDGNVANIYTYVAADMEQEPIYILSEIEGERLYHLSSCEDMETVEGYGSAYECAKSGANPHQCIYVKEE